MQLQEQILPLADVALPLEVELERRFLTLAQLLKLDTGNIVELTRSAGENVDLYVGGELFGYGEVVVIENAMGVRITDFRSEE